MSLELITDWLGKSEKKARAMGHGDRAELHKDARLLLNSQADTIKQLTAELKLVHDRAKQAAEIDDKITHGDPIDWSN